MKLVIVESPTKAKTISKFLGKDFRVESSYGHLRDLPKSKLGIDTEENFEPHYIIPMKSKKRANELKKVAEEASEIILASDEDREGEAIAWHITHILGDDKKYKRIVFHEITKSAVLEALENPREININMVNAQQARRVLDRLVGYKLSPFLWKKMYRGLSAGRVQSVAVRMVVEREREIEKFKSEEFWTLTASLNPKDDGGKSNIFEARLIKKDGEVLDKFAIKSDSDTNSILKELAGAKYKIEKIVKKETKRSPYPPFTTSTLQQTSSSRLGYSAKQTMMIAQKLYENGHITYMRTDSLNLSKDSMIAAKNTIEKNIGKEFALTSPRHFKIKSKTAQEAHEAIRPTDPLKTPNDLKNKLEPQHYKLYNLIWQRFIACQMKESIFDATSIDITASLNNDTEHGFRANGSTIKFDGWLKIYSSSFSESLLPDLKNGESLNLIKMIPEQHFTEPPPRYSEASLVKALEEYGIGRPSTYAPVIGTIQDRNYVEKNEQKKFIPTEIGIMVNDILVEHFPDIVDIQFTAKMEDNLDAIAAGKEEWRPVIKRFYEPFAKNLEEKYETVEKKETTEKTDESCAECGKDLIIKHGRFGKFMACSGFPDCKFTKALPAIPFDIKCPKCESGDVVARKTKKGRIFYGCSKWPDCNFATWQKPTGKLCIECGEPLVELKNKIKCSNKSCSFTHAVKKDVKE